mmetsp:Transcript_14903/g.31599  ORF Transcript_14903/g.31599 Transcript_14903/m.31599 type:complete len:498 (+) Transcript_14903:1035-2528(+)
MPRLLRQPQNTIAPRRSSQLLIRTFLVQIGTGLILVCRTKCQCSLLKVRKDSPRRTFNVELIVFNQFLQDILLGQFEDTFGGDAFVNAIIQITKPKDEIMIGYPHGFGTHGPLGHGTETNDFLDGLGADFEGSLGEHVGKVGVTARNILPVGCQVGTHEAQRRIVKLKTNRCSSLVPHDSHDTHPHTIGLHILHTGFMRVFDKNTHQQTHQILVPKSLIRPIRIAQRILTRIQSFFNPPHPKIGARLTFILHGDIDGIQIDHFLKSHHDNVRQAVLVPIGAKPTGQTLFLPLGVDVPRSNEQMALFVLREFILTRTDLFVDPCIADFRRGLAVADASVLGFFVGGAVGDDDAGVVRLLFGVGGGTGHGHGTIEGVGGIVGTADGGGTGGVVAGCGRGSARAAVVHGGSSGDGTGGVVGHDGLGRRWGRRGRLHVRLWRVLLPVGLGSDGGITGAVAHGIIGVVRRVRRGGAVARHWCGSGLLLLLLLLLAGIGLLHH